MRCLARVSLMSLAARRGEKARFDEFRGLLSDVLLPPEIQVNFLIESARGERAFGAEDEATTLLQSARELAQSHGLNWSVFEANDMMATPTPELTKSGEIQVPDPDPAAHVVDGLRRMLASVAG